MSGTAKMLIYTWVAMWIIVLCCFAVLEPSTPSPRKQTAWAIYVTVQEESCVNSSDIREAVKRSVADCAGNGIVIEGDNRF